MTDELELIEALTRRLPPPPPGEVWIGDDAAVLESGRLLATDVVVEHVHFDLTWCTPTDVGWRALAVNVSDIAAMGGTPGAAVTTLVAPTERSGEAEGVTDGLLEAARHYGVDLVGGDISTGPALMVNVAIEGQAPETGAVLRSGAGPGETMWVTGPLGGAAAALQAQGNHAPADPAGLAALRRPDARVEAGQAAAEAGATAMIDVSDGLAIDAIRMARASAVGLELDAGRLPLGAGATVDDALAGGDDYELCFAAPDPERVTAAFAKRRLASPTAVGATTADPSTRLLSDGRHTRDLQPRGWVHHRG